MMNLLQFFLREAEPCPESDVLWHLLVEEDVTELARGWTPFHSLWLAVADGRGPGCGALGWSEALGLIPRALHDADLRGVDLTGANLRGVNLNSADLSGADLSGANLVCSNLYGADLRSAKLTWTDLTDANLCSADLRKANIRDAILDGANLRFTLRP